MLYAAAAMAILVTMALTLCRAWLGPSIYDRILAINSFGTKTVVLIAVFGFLTERPEFLDIALVYALINFIGTIAVLKLFEHGDLGSSIHRPASPGAASAKHQVNTDDSISVTEGGTDPHQRGHSQ